MKEKKYIDRLYQEKFKDFEATPGEDVWQNISAKLREKEEKKPVITPFWSRMAGIAAVFTLILLLGEWIFPERTPAVVNKELEKTFRDRLDFSRMGVVFTAPDKADDSEKRDDVFQKVRSAELQRREVSGISSSNSPETPEISIMGNQIISEEGKQDHNKKEDRKISLFEEISKRENMHEEQQIVVESSKGKFEISTHAAPIYYGNFGKGNFIDARYNNKNSQGDITYSYGINLAYAISNKVKIRSGVNKVNMSYTTNGIVYSAIIGPVPVSSITMKASAKDAHMSAATSGTRTNPVAGSERSTVGSLLPGLLNQKMGFIEIPVEVEYNLIDKKFELNIIGGASTLFLDQNSISVNSGTYSAVGKANNLNEISFSTNIGLGLDYNLSDKFKLNLEPMLKYQLNTFNAASADSQPFYLGVYSGFSYKF